MSPAKLNYKIYQGSTFQEAYRWETQTKVYVPIQSISKAAPCVITTAEDHNLPIGWRFRVTGAGGMNIAGLPFTVNSSLGTAVYGQEDSKLQIMQFIGTKIANPRGRGLSLLFVGPPGVGKTSLIKKL